MFETTGCREMVGPGLRAFGKLVIPAQGGNARQGAFAIVAR